MENIGSIKTPGEIYPVRRAELRPFMSLSRESMPVSTETSAVSPGEKKDRARLRETAQNFEAVFIRCLLRSMRSTLETGGIFGSGIEGDIYADMMDMAVADGVSRRGVMGIGEMLVEYLTPRGGQADDPTIQEKR